MCEHDEHLAERGFYEYLDHPETDISLYDGPIVKLHDTPGYLASPAPLFGEHTFEVATEVLGLHTRRGRRADGFGSVELGIRRSTSIPASPVA